MAGGFCAGAHEQPTNNWLSVGQRVGFATSVAVAQAVSSPRQRRSNNDVPRKDCLTATSHKSQLQLVETMNESRERACCE